MAVYSIYYLICPVDGKVRYVGKSRNPKQRYKDHVADVGDTTGKKKWVTKLKSLGLTPVLKIVQQTNNLLIARELEQRHLIKNIGTVYNIFQPAKKTCTVNDYRVKNKIKPDLEFITISKYDKLPAQNTTL